jgi:hypothetical protein
VRGVDVESDTVVASGTKACSANVAGIVTGLTPSSVVAIVAAVGCAALTQLVSDELERS